VLQKYFALNLNGFSIQLLFVLAAGLSNAQNILLYEDFETGDFAAKGWYDGFPDYRTSTEAKNGMYAYEGHFSEGSTTSHAGRHLFAPTERVYLSYWVKYSANYIGSGVGYHPHEFNILTDQDWIYQGPADTYLTLYVEQNGGRPILAMQDSKNVDPDCILLNNDSFIGCNGDFASYSFTENRSVCSCNGLLGFVDRRDCFASAGSTHGYYSARAWRADTVYFQDDPGPFYKNDWHFVETYFEMNTIENGIGIANGKIRYWYDGLELISSDSILFRTAVHPDMKFNQLFFGGYIGPGSPVDQTWWVDDLTLADGLPTTGMSHPVRPENDWNIFPTLSDGMFVVKTPEIPETSPPFELLIFDGNGKVVYRKVLQDTNTRLDLMLAPGIYYAALQSKNIDTRTYRRLVIMSR
jgi:hypothetical protein